MKDVGTNAKLKNRLFSLGDEVRGTVGGKEYKGIVRGFEDGRSLAKDRASENGLRYPVQAHGWAYHVDYGGDKYVILPEELLQHA